ncbi:MAG: NMD3-related protein, partial [Candidatus Micrarchaeota archaeon]
WLEMHRLVETPDKIVINKCRKCGIVKHGNAVTDNFEGELPAIIKSKTKSKLFRTSVDISGFDEKTGMISFTVCGYIDRNSAVPIKSEAKAKLEIGTQACENCVKLSGSYFEAMIQLRRSKQFDLLKYKKMETVIKQMARKKGFESPEARVFWTEENRDGINFFFGSKKAAAEITEQMAHQFRAHALKTQELRGVDKNGKKKMRTTYCLRV